MRASISTEDLRAGVSTVIAALAQKSEAGYTRAYEFVRIEAEDGKLTLCCCNLSIQIETSIPAHIEEAGMALFPGKLLSELVRVLPGEETVLEGAPESVRVCSGAVDMRLQSIDADGFLSMAVNSVVHSFRVNEGRFKRMITQTAPMALQDSTRPILGGVLIETEDDTLTLVALDGLKLAKRTEAMENTGSREPGEFVVNAKMLESAARVLTDSEGSVSISLSRQNVMITTQDTVMILRTIEGQFVKYKGMLPKLHDTSVRLEREKLYRAVERAYLVARDDRNNLVKLSFEEESLTISVNNEVGRVHDTIDISMSGSPILTAFNARYLLDILKNIDDDEIVMELTVKPGPCVIRPVDGDAYYYLVLPVRLA